MSDRFDINHVYNILGLKPGASVEEVKQAYRQMAKTWHPDSFLEPQQKLVVCQNEFDRLLAFTQIAKLWLVAMMTAA